MPPTQNNTSMHANVTHTIKHTAVQVQSFHHFQSQLYITHGHRSHDHSIEVLKAIVSCAKHHQSSRVTLPVQYFNHTSDYSVHCANRTKNCKMTEANSGGLRVCQYLIDVCTAVLGFLVLIVHCPLQSLA